MKKVKEAEVVNLGPQVREGEEVFGVARIFASFNDTFVVFAGVISLANFHKLLS